MATGPYSYVQYAQATNEPVIKEIKDSYIKNRAVFTLFPIRDDIGTQKRVGSRVIGGLPAITTLQIGQEPATPFVQDTAPYEEGAFLIRDNFDIDKLYLKDKQYIDNDPTALQFRSYLRARAFMLNNYFINNSHTGGPIADVNGAVGLKYRLAFPALYNNNVACNIQSSATMSDATSGTNMVKFFRDLDIAFDHMDATDGEGVIIFVNPQLKRQIDLATRLGSGGGGFTVDKDQFDRVVTKYKSAEFHSVGYQAPSQAGVQSTPVISSAQDANGWDSTDTAYNSGSTNQTNTSNPTGSNFTSLYLVKAGEGDFETWAIAPPSIEKVMVAGTRKWRAMFDMSWGLWNPNTRAIARIYGVLVNGSSND